MEPEHAMKKIITFSVIAYTDPLAELFVCGSLVELGCWNAVDAVPLQKKQQISGQNGPSFWFKEVAVSQSFEELNFQYKYIIYDGKDYIWEGQGPWDNRNYKYESSSHIVNVYIIPVAHWREKSGHTNEFKHTTKFYKDVSSHNLIHISKILDNLYVGSCPRIHEHIKTTLKIDLAITAVMNFQTKEDIMMNSFRCFRHVRNHVSRNMSALDSVYRTCGISYIWLPVTDMSSEARQQMLPHAVYILKGLLDNGHNVYVHCNAGVGRSVAVVCGYLLFVLNWKYRQMEQHIFANRPMAFLDSEALHLAWKDFRIQFGEQQGNK